MNKFFVTITALFISTMTLQVHAAAWRTCEGNKIKWGSNTVTMRAGNVSFPLGSAFANSLQTTVNRANDNPSKFNFSLVFGDTSVKRNNNQNEIWFSNDQGILDGAPAIALTWKHCYRFFGLHYGIDEVDVVFNAGTNYTTSMTKTNIWPFGGPARPFQTTALHELGHAMGLLHENRWYNIMGQDWDHIHVNGDTARSYLGEDAADGSVALYGATAGAMEDVSLTNFKYQGTSGEYSTHQPTRLYNSSDAVLNSFVDNGERRYRVNKNQTVKLELTAENNGKSVQNVKIAYYISSNSIISTGDRLIGTGNLTLTRNQPYTFKRNLVIPGDLTSGNNYWIGAVIDYDDALTETVSSNNATYIPIRVN
jgi:hypothetical protein